jgi:ABC-type uncharacterized transport system permease subunit
MPCIYEGMKADVMLRALVHAAVVLITCMSRLVLFVELKESRVRTTSMECIYIYVCMYVCIYICIYTYIHTYERSEIR